MRHAKNDADDRTNVAESSSLLLLCFIDQLDPLVRPVMRCLRSAALGHPRPAIARAPSPAGLALAEGKPLPRQAPRTRAPTKHHHSITTAAKSGVAPGGCPVVPAYGPCMSGLHLIDCVAVAAALFLLAISCRRVARPRRPSIHTFNQNLVAVLNDPTRAREPDLFTRDWCGLCAMDKQHCRPPFRRQCPDAAALAPLRVPIAIHAVLRCVLIGHAGSSPCWVCRVSV